MKIKNTTDIPTQVIRRILGWVCALNGIDVKPGAIRDVEVQNTRVGCHSGRCRPWRGWILLKVGTGPNIERAFTRFREQNDERFPHDRMEALVVVAAHEVLHLQHVRSLDGGRIRRALEEGEAAIAERIALAAFRADRKALLARWYLGVAQDLRPVEERVALARMVAVQRREDKARASLSAWERKLKTAQRKVKEYRAKVRYYDKKTADRKIDLG